MSKLYTYVKSLALTLLIIGSVAVHAQTIIINPSGDGGFSNGPDFTSNGWTVVNTTTTPYNAWWVGTAPVGIGSGNVAYISDDAAGATHNYSTSQGNQVHFYRDVTIPQGESAFLQFDIIVNGENNYDLLQVSIAPTTVTPTASTTFPGFGTGPIVTGATVLGNYSMLGTTSQTITISIPSNILNNCNAPATVRLIFSWKSDTSVGTQPPVAIDNISLVSTPLTPSPTAGTFTIDNTLPTAGTNFNNFTAAITWLNAAQNSCAGINNPIVFNVTAGQTFTELPPAIIATGTAANTITFQKSGTGSNPIILATNGVGTADAGIVIAGGDYITFDGIDIQDNPANTTINAQMEYGYLIRNASATDGALNNTIKNCNVSLNITRTTAIGILVSASTTGGGFTPTATSGTNSNNLIDSVFVENCGLGGILVTSGSSTYPGVNNQVLNSTIGAGYVGIPNGSIGTGTTTAYGIQFNNQSDFNIKYNKVRNLVSTGTKRGIYVLGAQGTSTVSHNIVQGIRNNSTTSTLSQRGMDLALSTTGTHTLNIYNNMISDILADYTGTATGTRVLIGTILGSGSATSTYNFDFNSISIDGTASITASNVCLELGGSTATNNIRNNILANYTGAQTGIAKHYCIRSTSATAMGSASSVVNFNDYYLLDIANGFTALTNTTDQATITDWDNAITTPSAPIDVNSVAVDPQFFDIKVDLHTTSPNVAGIGDLTGITWVTDDIDGQPRTTPIDIGADQFSPPATIDMGAIVLVSPLTTGCHSSSENVIVKIKNYSTQPIDFSVNNTTVTCNVTGAATQTFNVTLNNNSLNGGNPLAPGDSLDVPMGVLNMTASGIYTFDAFTTVNFDGAPANNAMPTVNITVGAGTISALSNSICFGSGATLNATGFNGTIQWESSTDGGITWNPIAGATNATLIDSPLVNTDYRLVACGTNTSNVITINVTVTAPPTAVGDTVCGQGSVTLTANGSGTLLWYNDSIGGSPLFTGSSFTTNITATDTFYVENVDGGGLQFVGPLNPNAVGTFGSWNSTAQWMNFTVSQPLTLVSVDMFFSSAIGSPFSLIIRDAVTLTTVHTYNGTVSVSNPTPTTPQTVPLNAILSPGTYQIGYGTATNTFRNNAGAVYPYQIPGVLSITGNTFNQTYYYMFYNWAVFTGCPSTRTPVIAVSTPADTVNIIASATNICSGDSVTLIASSANADYIYTWSPLALTGDTVGSVINNTTTITVNANDTISGCSNSASITITANQYPTFTLSATPSNICLGDTAQLLANTSSTYCAGGPSSTADSNVESVSMTGENGSSLNYTGCPGVTGVQNLLTQTVEVIAGNSYTINIEFGTCGGNYAGAGEAWIDFNHNGIYEPSESILQTSGTPGTGAWAGVQTFNINIPSNAINGVTRMRINQQEGGTLPLNPCATFTWGSVMEFSVLITGGQSALTYAWMPSASLNDASIFNPLATPTTTTTYFVDVTNGAGCTTTDSIVVTVNPAPVVNLGADTVVCGAASLTLDAGNAGANYLWNDNSTNQTLLVTANGTYSVTVTELVNNCSATDSIAVSFGTVPTVTLPADTAICAGSSLTIDAGAGYASYNWNNGDQTQTTTVNSAGTYSVTITNNDGCAASDSIVVTVNALPVVNLGNDTTVCNNQNITLDAGAGFASYTWTPSGNTQTITVTGANTVTTYTVTVIDNNGCSNTDAIVVTYSSCVGMDDNSNKFRKLEIYPNPTNGNFIINFGEILSDTELNILDMNGKLVYSEVISKNASTIKQVNIEKLPAGIYILSIRSNNEIQTLRISKY